MSQVRISTADAGDVAALVDLCSALFAEDAGTRDPHTDSSWPAERGRAHFLGLLADDDALCLLALSGEDAIGYLAGHITGPTALRPVRVAELQSMHVRRARRGQGVGGRLVDEFRGWARYRHAGLVSVAAYAANEGAIRFYQRLGFGPMSVTLEGTL